MKSWTKYFNRLISLSLITTLWSASIQAKETPNEKVSKKNGYQFQTTSEEYCVGDIYSLDDFLKLQFPKIGQEFRRAMSLIDKATPVVYDKLMAAKDRTNVCITDIGYRCSGKDGQDKYRALLWLKDGDITKDSLCMDEAFFINNSNVSATDQATVIIKELYNPIIEQVATARNHISVLDRMGVATHKLVINQEKSEDRFIETVNLFFTLSPNSKVFRFTDRKKALLSRLGKVEPKTLLQASSRFLELSSYDPETYLAVKETVSYENYKMFLNSLTKNSQSIPRQLVSILSLEEMAYIEDYIVTNVARWDSLIEYVSEVIQSDHPRLVQKSFRPTLDALIQEMTAYDLGHYFLASFKNDVLAYALCSRTTTPLNCKRMFQAKIAATDTSYFISKNKSNSSHLALELADRQVFAELLAKSRWDIDKNTRLESIDKSLSDVLIEYRYKLSSLQRRRLKYLDY
ncbi:MAG: hypothetical protein AB8E15_12230 [Bdellovibrionales bacterium]